MPATPPPVPIAVFGSEEAATSEARGCSLWPIGYSGAITAAGGAPIFLPERPLIQSWKETLQDAEGVVCALSKELTPRQISDGESLIRYCREQRVPLLAVDQAMLLLNTTGGGTLYENLAKEFPEALQHRHPPEKGLRHAIMVNLGTRLCSLYGEGEVVVNSEHRKAVQKVASGFRVGACALDGVIEAIESEADDWFAMAVQWRPASASASGLDIQLFRGLVEACLARKALPVPVPADSHAA